MNYMHKWYNQLLFGMYCNTIAILRVSVYNIFLLEKYPHENCPGLDQAIVTIIVLYKNIIIKIVSNLSAAEILSLNYCIQIEAGYIVCAQLQFFLLLMAVK